MPHVKHKHKHKLLVVEDEASVRSLVSQILTSLGHEVRSAEDGFSALKEIQQSTPDIILSDLNMPGMSGFELLSVVRRRLPGIYVIATSGAYTGPDIPLGIAADAFYEKASGLQALLGVVSAVSEADLIPSRQDAGTAPIWICRDASSGDEKNLVINCPECLRNSSQPYADSTLTIHETKCPYCSAAISYAIIRPMDVNSSQANLPALSPMHDGTQDEPDSELAPCA